MKKELSRTYHRYLKDRDSLLDQRNGRFGLSARGLWVGAFLSLYLAVGAPYVRMAMRSTVMAFDFNTPGAIFLFLVLVGLLNVLFKVVGRSRERALFAAVGAVGLFLAWYGPQGELDFHSPGLLFNLFIVSSILINLPLVWNGLTLVLNRAELVLVYVMLLVVSALCTMGMSQQLLPGITAFFYYASPENKWLEKLLPHLPPHQVLVNDGRDNRAFYEGAAGLEINYGTWVEPLCWWAIFLLALYAVMVSAAVILRRQWMERERLAYPLTQVGLALVAGEEKEGLVNGLFRKRAFWCGAAIPLLVGSMTALHHYDSSVPTLNLHWSLPFVGQQNLQFSVRFAMIGFSYLINTQVAAGLWLFHLLSKVEYETLLVTGVQADQRFVYGVHEHALLAYQGGGALIAMVLLGFWIGRAHLKAVLAKALGRAPEVDDSDEIMSYRSAVIGLVGGSITMSLWLWIMGTKLWVALLFVGLALLIFVGITRVVAEAGLAAVRSPMIAPDLVMQGLGSQLVGASGVFNLSLAYIWCGDIRIFVMAVLANGLKLIEEMDRKSRRYVFWGVVLALLIGAVGSCWMVFHLVHIHGGINLDGWRFKSGPLTIFDRAVRNLEPSGVYWQGLGFFAGGGVVMLLLTWVRQRVLWWPFHPVGFPIGANMLMNHIWFSVFIAWSVKKAILRFGGASVYRASEAFFLGLIMGEALCNGLWVVIDYFTGKMGNVVFGIG